MVLPEGAADTLALWCAHTHCYECFTCSPRLNITSPEKRCGKSTLRDVIASLVNRPLSLENLTTAAALRLADKYKPTILADEYDGWLPENEELRSLLNSGYKQGGLVVRCEGERNEPRLFNAFCPAALCGIGDLKGKLATLHDRSIIIRLARAKPSEVRARFDLRRTTKEKDLCRKLARFCADNKQTLAAVDPILPAGAFHRLADNWRPLFAIAAVAGQDWPHRCAAAFAKHGASQDDTDVETLKVMLLSDTREVITEKQLEPEDWIETSELIGCLTAMPERPWSEANRGKPINARWLSVKLGDFGIKPGRLPRDGGGQTRGYHVAAFQESFERYLSVPSVTSGQVSEQPFLRTKNAETDSETDAETDAKSQVSHCFSDGKTPVETDVQIERGGESGFQKGMTLGQFMAQSAELFHAKVATA